MLVIEENDSAAWPDALRADTESSVRFNRGALRKSREKMTKDEEVLQSATLRTCLCPEIHRSASEMVAQAQHRRGEVVRTFWS